MGKTLTRFLRRHLFHLVGWRRLFLPSDSYLRRVGWIETLKRGYPCDDHGLELPWMNYPVIGFFRERLKKGMKLFEFGSGYSTSFFARHVETVVSVEHSQEWVGRMRSRIPENAVVLFREADTDGSYCRSIAARQDEYDVVIVDGRDRVNCVRQAVRNLSESGVVVLDDSDREAYSGVFDYMGEIGFRALQFEGLKPSDSALYRTTIFYRDGNCLAI